jgi:glycosyltransferase involved in cell wall biosynthesis
MALREEGVAVRVLTTGDPRVESYEGLPTRRLGVHRYLLNLAASAIAESARDADLIHTFNYHACLPSLRAARRLRKPVVCVVLGLFGNAWLEMRPEPLGRAWRAWERYLLTREYDRVVFLSEYSREQGLALGVSEARALVHCPGIDFTRVRAALAKEDVVLFAGKFEPRKGVFDVLEAARALPDLRFRMAGWGPAEAAIRRAAPPNLEIVERTGAALYDELARARVFLFPSRAETFGIVLAEAMASGCAIVSTVPLEFEGARIVAGDVPSLLAALRRVWDDRPASLEMGRRNRELARRYTWTRHAAEMRQTYDRVLAERKENGRG